MIALVVQPPGARFLSFEEVREIAPVSNQAAWDRLARSLDQEVRARVRRGVEDSVSNLILYGTSFTALPRAESALAPDGGLSAPARARLAAFLKALPNSANERVQSARRFLKPEPNLGSRLEANLLRFAREQRAYEERLAAAGHSPDPGELLFARATLYSERGLSVDTSLLPNYAIEDTLRVLAEKGVALPGSVRRVAVVGPGLDFADKREGYDFYPLQTLQPFAVLEAALRLKLAPENVRLAVLDLNPLVLAHLRERAGKPYVIQLPRDPAAGWNEAAVGYWTRFGEIIGRPTTPLRPPNTLAALATRAVAIAPKYTAITPLDVDIVTQTPREAGFDLVIATNVLVYYDRFRQALAMAAVAAMMNPGGLFLSNTVLPAQHPRTLEFLGRRSVSYSAAGAFGDDMVVYRRR